jgi:hypothetical protein
VLRLLLFAVLAGVVVAATAFPAVAVLGVATTAAVGTYDSLPTDLKAPDPPQASRVYAADGTTLITAFYDEDRADVALA